MIYVYGIVGLSIIVFAHELGHFCFAKLFKIKVERFSIGIGKRLFGFNLGGTDYCVSLFPLGGYCKMMGEDAFLRALDQNPHTEIQHPKGSFYAAHPLQRIVVAAMGPAFNIVFAFLALAIVLGIGVATPSLDNRVILARDYPSLLRGDDLPNPSPAEQSGLRSSDRVVAIDGKPIDSYLKIQKACMLNPGKKLNFLVEREGNLIKLNCTPYLDKKNLIGRIGILGFSELRVTSVKQDSPAARCGLRSGDSIVSIDGKPANNSLDMDAALVSHPTKLALRVRSKEGLERECTLSPVYDLSGTYDLGYSLPYVVDHRKSNGFPAIIRDAWSETVYDIVLSFRTLALVFRTGNFSQALAGPLRITGMVGETMEAGFSSGFASGLTGLLDSLAIISIGLFITNLLPIPVLDGGLIILFLIELFRRKQMHAKTIYRLTTIGFFVIVGLFLLATLNDILSFGLH